MGINCDLKKLAEILREIFQQVYEEIKKREITDRTLDSIVLDAVKKFEISKKDLVVKFSEPKDAIYNAKKGRTPYDLLCFGKIQGKDFEIWINNKFGNLKSNTRNDITTYNNLLRLYLGISKQRMTSEISLDKDLIKRRISGEEIVAYGVFVVDKNKRGMNFFLLEEIEDEFYVNPRNTMFQVKYNPSLGAPVDYSTFCKKLINAISEAFNKSSETIKEEEKNLREVSSEIDELIGEVISNEGGKDRVRGNSEGNC